jgi:predicted metal-dependent hydrolase
MSLFGPRYADGQRLRIAGIVVRLKVSSRARRISLRLDRLSGEAVAIAPSTRHLADAAAFARSREGWLGGQLARISPPASAIGDQVTVFGETWRLRPDGRRPHLAALDDALGQRLSGCGDGHVDAQLVVRAIRRHAQGVFQTRAAVHCAALSAEPPPIQVGDARTRWGSCTPAQRGRQASIRLSWRLALAPFAVADYVVAHECAHLLEANHGPRFWAHVRALVGDERPHRAWLRREGESLHAVLPKP